MSGSSHVEVRYFSCKESWFFCCSGQLRATITSSGLVPRVEGQGGSRTANLAEKPEMVRPFCLGAATRTMPISAAINLVN